MATPPPIQEPPTEAPAPPAPTKTQQGAAINLGSQSVIAVKLTGAILAIIVLIVYLFIISYYDSPFWVFAVVFGGIGVGLGIAGIFVGNLKISKKPNIPTLNIILIIISIIFLLLMPVFGNWNDPNTIGDKIWNVWNILEYLAFALLLVGYIELAHASIRFSQIDDYVTSHNIQEFSVGSVITNYTMWLVILMILVFIMSLCVLILPLGLANIIKSTAPQFGYSLEYNSPYAILISIALVFVPIGIILTFIFGYLVKSRRSIVVKGKEDIVALRPEQVRVKE